jgi:hypothetical protein
MAPNTLHHSRIVAKFAIALWALSAGCSRAEKPSVPTGNASAVGAPPAASDPASYAFVLRAMELELGDVDAGFLQIVAPVAGTLRADSVASHRFAANAGHCYRIYATGGIDIERLTVSVIAADHVTEVAAATAVHALSIGVRHPLCPPIGGQYEVRVHADRSGDYAIAVYATP